MSLVFLEEPIESSLTDRCRRALQQLGFAEFRSPEQAALVTAVAGGHDVIGILPTGGGKSAAYIVPALVHNWCVLIISPLKALMDDQAEKLRRFGCIAYAIHSGQPPEYHLEATFVLRQAATKPRFVFV